MKSENEFQGINKELTQLFEPFSNKTDIKYGKDNDAPVIDIRIKVKGNNYKRAEKILGSINSKLSNSKYDEARRNFLLFTINYSQRPDELLNKRSTIYRAEFSLGDMMFEHEQSYPNSFTNQIAIKDTLLSCIAQKFIDYFKTYTLTRHHIYEYDMPSNDIEKKNKQTVSKGKK